MRKIKKMGALITAAALTVTLIGTGADASAFSKTKYGFMALLEEHGFPGIQEAYRRRCCTLGSRVHVIGTEIDFIGTAEDIDETGALLVRDESGVLQRVLSGDVSVRGVMGYV